MKTKILAWRRRLNIKKIMTQKKDAKISSSWIGDGTYPGFFVLGPKKRENNVLNDLFEINDRLNYTIAGIQ